MATTLIRPESQVAPLFAYDDTLAAGVALESAANFEVVTHGILSQIKRIGGETNWYDALSGRDLATASADLLTLEQKTHLYRCEVLQSVAVGASNAFVVLSVAGSETPTETAAVGAVTTEGAVVAAHGGTFGTASLDEVAGKNAIRPKNLVEVVDANGDPILSSGRVVYGLLQSENGTDGHTFDDASNQVQLSFVRLTAGGDDLELVPGTDIGGQTIRYSYTVRMQKQNVPEESWLGGAFVDQSAAVDVTRQNAYDNQSGDVSIATAAVLDLQAAVSWEIGDATSAPLFVITEGSGGGTSTFAVLSAVDNYDNDAVDVDFANGTKHDTSGSPIHVGVTAGTIESVGAAVDLTLLAGRELFFDDANRSGSTWSAAVKLTDTQAEWNDLETTFGGEFSIAKMLVDAFNNSAQPQFAFAVVTAATVSSDTNVTGAGGSPNLDAQLLDYSTLTFADDVRIYLNGVRLRPGADATANFDVYPGDTPANGDIKFESPTRLFNGDTILMEAYGL